MVTEETATQELPEGMYDPDDEAPNEFGSLVGTLARSVLVDGGKVYPSQGAENDARILDNVSKFTAGNSQRNIAPYHDAVWFLEAEGISVVREDGTPFRQSQIVKLKAKNGRTSNTPNQVAKLFKEQGVTASYAHVGQPDSAVGRIFEFDDKKIKVGPYDLRVKVYPTALMDEGYVYSGEVRTIKPKQEGEGSAPADGGASAALPESEVIQIVQEALTGVDPAGMMQAILDETRLASVATIFGVPLLDSATDESLATVLQENRCMAIGSDGKLQPIVS